MSQMLIEECCATCGHQVVYGVACDWQPEICPLTAHTKNSRAAHQGTEVMPVMPEEYDAILSNN